MTRVIADINEHFERAFIDGSETSDWFKVGSGVKQGCVMSGFLLDWITNKAMEDKRRVIRWNYTTMLEDLNCHPGLTACTRRLGD